MQQIFIAYLLLAFGSLYAQDNLVINGSFEFDTRWVDNQDGMTCGSSKHHWRSLIGVYAINNADAYLLGGFNNLNSGGKGIKPSHGKRMVGLVTYSNQTDRGYTILELHKSLVKGREYLISFDATIDKKAPIYSSDIGFLFLPKRLDQLDLPFPDQTPTQYEGQLLINKWKNISFKYTPSEDSLKYLVIGNFKSDKQTRKIKNRKAKLKKHQRGNKTSYSWVDNIIVQTATPLQNELSFSPIEIKDTIIKTKDKTNIVLNKTFHLNFANNSYEIKDSNFKAEINHLVDSLALLNLNYQIIINGHTDNVGPAQENLKLSKNRAEAVQKLFQNKGIKKSLIQTNGFGESQPIAPNNKEQNRALNRRVEIIIQTIE